MSLADAFREVGLISPEEHDKIRVEQENKTRAQEGAQLHSLTRKSGRPANFDRLQTCQSINEFKDTARQVLTEYPEGASEVAQLAHRFQGQEGSKRLIWIVLSVRKLLPLVTDDQRDQFLRKAFRKANPVVELPK